MFSACEVYPSNLSVVSRSRSMPCTKLVIFLGTPLLCMLYSNWDGTAFGKAPSMSRKSTAMTFLALHADLILCVRRCMASVCRDLLLYEVARGTRLGLGGDCLEGAREVARSGLSFQGQVAIPEDNLG